MEQFGPYTLIERIGSGGMCEVFRARRKNTAKDVALKRLHAELQDQRNAVDLFLTEADLAVLLEHPNLVHTYESDEVNGRYFIAMELIDGLDLAKAQRLGPERDVYIDVPMAVHIAAELYKGLAHLHAARSPAGRCFNLVHRDVSPENLFLTRAGEVKLADFGIAKVGRLESVTSVFGGVKGKVGYMAPEQIRGEQLDGRADQFAAALILYELVTGHKPYALRDGETELEQAMRVREANIPPAGKLEPELPAELDALLRQALHRKPRKRFASCAAVAVELADLTRKQGWQVGAVEVAALVGGLLGTAAPPA